MRLRGGYNILLEGKPSEVVERLPEPKELYLPLRSNRFLFSDISVEDGQTVNEGDVLAKDPNNYAVPLLAPRGGKTRLNDADGHIILTDIHRPAEKAHVPEKDFPHIAQKVGSAGMKRYKLLLLGAWQFFYDAYTGQLPDPLGTPQAAIISTLSLEPFLARGDVQLKNRLLQFTRGLEHLQSLLEYQPIYLIMPDIKSPFASQVRQQIRGYAWAKLIEVPLKYPYDNFNILARGLSLKKNAGPIWAVRTEGILAIDRALTMSKPCIVKIVSIGGPGVKSPVHLKAMTGYSVKTILEKYVSEINFKVFQDGILKGSPVVTLGLDTECRGLTILPEHTEREFLGFMRPGRDRRSYSGCFLSSLRKGFDERLTNAVRGELRPCISCNFCEEVCPAGIMPHLIHKHLYQGYIEDAARTRIDLCVECGLCSFVCPSKIELTQQFIEAKALIEKEKEEIRMEQQLRQSEKEMVK